MSTDVIETDVEDETVALSSGTTEEALDATDQFRDETAEPDEPHAKFGWCQTHHHGHPFGHDVPPGLCPGKSAASKGYLALTCGCGCHRGVEPSFRATPRAQMANPEDLIAALHEGEDELQD